MIDKLLTIGQVAELLGVKRSTIYQWTHMGTIPHTKIGSLVRFREKDVLAWIEKRSKITKVRKPDFYPRVRKVV